LFYVLALWLWLRGRESPGRIAWTIGCILFLVHVAAAFQFHHAWSHGAAYRATALETKKLFGVDYGGGLYWNYTFALVWLSDAVWRWLGTGVRSDWISRSVHGFMAFMFFNGTMVFASGPIRWCSLAAMIGLGAAWWKSRQRPRIAES
jgi:hypothetical protein